MPTIKDLSKVINSPELITIVTMAIRRSAWEILAAESAPANALAWARYARTEFNADRSQFFAQLAIELLVATSEDFRDLVDHAIAVGVENVQVPDVQLMQFVEPCVQIFINKQLFKIT